MYAEVGDVRSSNLSDIRWSPNEHKPYELAYSDPSSLGSLESLLFDDEPGHGHEQPSWTSSSRDHLIKFAQGTSMRTPFYPQLNTGRSAQLSSLPPSSAFSPSSTNAPLSSNHARDPRLSNASSNINHYLYSPTHARSSPSPPGRYSNILDFEDPWAALDLVLGLPSITSSKPAPEIQREDRRGVGYVSPPVVGLPSSPRSDMANFVPLPLPPTSGQILSESARCDLGIPFSTHSPLPQEPLENHANATHQGHTPEVRSETGLENTKQAAADHPLFTALASSPTHSPIQFPADTFFIFQDLPPTDILSPVSPIRNTPAQFSARSLPPERPLISLLLEENKSAFINPLPLSAVRDHSAYFSSQLTHQGQTTPLPPFLEGTPTNIKSAQNPEVDPVAETPRLSDITTATDKEDVTKDKLDDAGDKHRPRRHILAAFPLFDD
jgi:hypothetical protein